MSRRGCLDEAFLAWSAAELVSGFIRNNPTLDYEHYASTHPRDSYSK
jgi:hypothetical protein